MINGARINPETVIGLKSHRLHKQTLLCTKKGALVDVQTLKKGDVDVADDTGVDLNADPFAKSDTYKLDLANIEKERWAYPLPLWRPSPPCRRRPQDEAQRRDRGCFRRCGHTLKLLLWLWPLHRDQARMGFGDALQSPVEKLRQGGRQGQGRPGHRSHGPHGSPLLYFFLIARDYSPRLIASEGQTSAHVPHSVHTSGLIEYFSPSEIAPEGHSSIHVPQAMQLSPIT